jgi:hypothetical protein
MPKGASMKLIVVACVLAILPACSSEGAEPCQGDRCAEDAGSNDAWAPPAADSAASGPDGDAADTGPRPGTWLSGSFANEAEFGAWRGVPVAIVGFAYNNNVTVDNRTNITLNPRWAPATEFKVLETAYSLIDRSRGDSWATGASGALDATWRQGMRNVYDSWGTRKWLFIRPAHELNGQELYYVGAGDEADFKTTWIRFYDIVQEELVSRGKPVFVTFCANHVAWGDAVEVSDDLYPGDDYVDVIGVDYYDNGRHDDETSWESVASSTTASGNPQGLYTWQEFARRHHKPFATPEWGLETDSTTINDNPFFIQKMNEFFRANAGSGPGQVLYEQFFDAWGNSRLDPPTECPDASAMYLSLPWSDGAGVAWPPP